MGYMVVLARPTGQWLNDSGVAWWFDSGSLALDLAYTGPTPDAPAREQLAEPAALAFWLAERFDEIGGDVSDGDLRDAGALRAAIAHAMTAVAHGTTVASADVDIINLYAATPDIPPALAGGSRQAGRGRARVGQALSEVARSAVALFGDELRGRIRTCAADDCALIFFDGSRSDNRRWCSMQRCGNRAKVRAHRARLRARSTARMSAGWAG
jgi:predicted RNA-binding Zn ribbon-like protein